MVGVLMLDSVKKVELSHIDDAFPAFITMITMVLTYSIANGIALGILSYVIIKLCTGHYREINLTLTVLSIVFVLSFIFK